uniref:Type II toxin-antitoxin system HicB family antitoxin n=1 Tax=Candidatus Kentrum sp. LFY TaxID=2126342 RepID=A0A450X1F2_9GAMM|nr:MAG: Uncharacterised protein family (UPF0150) [Candidatus Kentron sp. LFY]
MTKQLTAIIEKEGNGYVALCPEVDVASQGDTVGQARENLKEALELFFEMASPEEVDSRWQGGKAQVAFPSQPDSLVRTPVGGLLE